MLAAARAAEQMTAERTEAGRVPAAARAAEQMAAERTEAERVPAAARAAERVPAAARAAEQSAAERTHHEHVARSPPLRRTARATLGLEPLSPERYDVQRTADAEVNRKIDLGRDLLRHALPDGDVAMIVGRALNLLLEKALQRRMAKTTRATVVA